MVKGFWSKNYDHKSKLISPNKKDKAKEMIESKVKLPRDHSGNFGQQDQSFVDIEINMSNLEGYELPEGVRSNPGYEQGLDYIEVEQISEVETNFKFNKL